MNSRQSTAQTLASTLPSGAHSGEFTVRRVAAGLGVHTNPGYALFVEAAAAADRRLDLQTRLDALAAVETAAAELRAVLAAAQAADA